MACGWNGELRGETQREKKRSRWLASSGNGKRDSLKCWDEARGHVSASSLSPSPSVPPQSAIAAAATTIAYPSLLLSSPPRRPITRVPIDAAPTFNVAPCLDTRPPSHASVLVFRLFVAPTASYLGDRSLSLPAHALCHLVPHRPVPHHLVPCNPTVSRPTVLCLTVSYLITLPPYGMTSVAMCVSHCPCTISSPPWRGQSSSVSVEKQW
ncbi:hypothetical protein GUJ93_ZPchr0006g45425 [Zizania palustris]|uniref:Uncharacterized protein n=1 Tax=Zizania palustris TaxID=103762 RepID=A0A8J5SRP5_ZIZPA|nr:hypothetical protein GUJ93_ZPchr0006g45425 [Zizania palustris]